MDDALFVGGLEGLSNLARDVQGLVQGEARARLWALGFRLWAALVTFEKISECEALDELEDEGLGVAVVFQAVDGADVGMVERGQDLGLAFEPGQPVGVLRERLGQDLQRHITVELRIARAIHLSHAALAYLAGHLVDAEADDVSQILARVLETEPDWTTLPHGVPAGVEVTLRRAFEKDPRQRLRDVGDFRLALGGGFEPPQTPSDVATPRPTWLPVATALAGLLVGAISAGVFLWNAADNGPPAPPRVERFAISTPPAPPLLGGGILRRVGLSPDGRLAMYRDQTSGQTGNMVVRALDSLEATVVPESAFGIAFSFSRDGEWVAFQDPRSFGLYRASLRGGPPLLVAQLDNLVFGSAWIDAETLILGTPGGLIVVPIAGGGPST